MKVLICNYGMSCRGEKIPLLGNGYDLVCNYTRGAFEKFRIFRFRMAAGNENLRD